MGMETEADGVPSYLQPDKEHDLDSELSLPSAPIGQAAVPAGRSNAQVKFIDCFFFSERKKKLMQDIKFDKKISFSLLFSLFKTKKN
jgi:hypothetical protein